MPALDKTISGQGQLELERGAIDMFAGLWDQVDELNKIAESNVLDRSFSKSGFMTTFSFPAANERSVLSTSDGHGVHSEIAGLKFGADFVLFLEDGAASLEGFSNAETWPEPVGSFTLHYAPVTEVA